jgi:hypothetical protein
MAWWTEVMRQLGDGRVPTPCNDEFFFWWHRQVIALEYYPNTRIDFRGDTDMPLPPISSCRDICMNVFLNISFFCRIKQKYFWMMSSTN